MASLSQASSVGTRVLTPAQRTEIKNAIQQNHERIQNEEISITDVLTSNAILQEDLSGGASGGGVSDSRFDSSKIVTESELIDVILEYNRENPGHAVMEPTTGIPNMNP